MGLVLSTKNLILKELSLMAKHEARRDIYKLDENRAEELKKIVNIK